MMISSDFYNLMDKGFIDEMMNQHRFGKAGETIVIEEFLKGREFSLLAFCDGQTLQIMPPVEDHK